MNRQLLRIIAGSVILIAAILIEPQQEWIGLALFVTSYLVAGYDVVLYALKNIFKGEVFDENFLMSLATIGAFFVGEYPEAVSVMLFYQLGELFQSYAEDKSRRSIRELMDIRPDYANVLKGDRLETMKPDLVKVGDLIVIKAGERIPLDARVTEGRSDIDSSALTGESLPMAVEVGSEILAGCINLSGVLTAEVIKVYGESTVSKILDLVENAGSKKSRSETFIRRFARYYTPIVVMVAVVLAFVPPLLISGETFGDWIYRALIFLVVSCPCALVVSVPLSFFAGIGGASKHGILVKGGNYLEALAQTETVAFDKTGTLTKGVLHVQRVHPVGMSEEELLELAALAESFSRHPISASLIRAYGKEVDGGRVKEVKEIPGHGVSATIDGCRILAGNEKLMNAHGISIQSETGEAETFVYVALDDSYAGFISMGDEIRDDGREALGLLKAEGVRETAMLTGDNGHVARKVGELLGIDAIYSQLLPTDKVAILEKLLLQKSPGKTLVFAGDGINDAPVLARADVGIAMGGLGSDAAIEAADVVIMTDEPSKIATAIRISKKTLKIARQNIAFAVSVKILVLLLGAFGMATMWQAVFADVGVTVLVVLNAFRALRT